MKIEHGKNRHGYLLRFRNKGYVEVAYLTFAVQGLAFEVEFPSDWHEKERAWMRISIGIASLNFSWPSRSRGDDHRQCQGPTYGFKFYSDMLWIKWGQPTGRPRNDPTKTFWMPWSWKHREHKILGDKETHPYRYELRDGEIQQRTATIQKESRYWTRYWLPRKKTYIGINIDFSDEVGERSGSWKGGCIGCSYEMKPGESPLQALRRMEMERKF